MTAAVKRLLIMRHAKSAWDTDATDDFNRPLASRGERDCATMSGVIRTLTPRVEHVLCSSAIRTRRTCELIQPALVEESHTAVVHYSDDLYAASLSQWLTYLGQLANTTKSVLLIGHNPALQSLLLYLAGDQVRPGANGKILPTATLGVLDIATTWERLHEDCAVLLNIYRPREVRAQGTTVEKRHGN